MEHKNEQEPSRIGGEQTIANKRETTTIMSRSKESDGRFSGGEEDETSRKRKKPRAQKKRTTQITKTNKGDKKTGGILVLQTYRSSARP